MSILNKSLEWWVRNGIRFLGGQSGQHIPTHKDFGLYGYDSGYRQCAADHGIILTEQGISSQPQEDE